MVPLENPFISSESDFLELNVQGSQPAQFHQWVGVKPIQSLILRQLTHFDILGPFASGDGSGDDQKSYQRPMPICSSKRSMNCHCSLMPLKYCMPSRNRWPVRPRHCQPVWIDTLPP